MQSELTLSDRERELLLELLRAERTDLPSEIRHSRTATYHDDLRERLQLVDSLIERLGHIRVS